MMLRTRISRRLCARGLFQTTRVNLVSAGGEGDTTATSSGTASDMFDRTAAARRDIRDLWESEKSQGERVVAIKSLLEKYRISPVTPREDDIVRGLGEAFDRLLLLTVPLGEGGADLLEQLLACAGRCGREVPVRTIQHIFSRVDSYAEAIAVFYAMRKSNVAMNMEAYYAMMYSLQRLEEESWALKFSDEVQATKSVSEQAMDFILNGCDNQLLPENKPWLGRVMYEDQDAAKGRRSAKEDYDALGAQWSQRYKSGAL